MINPARLRREALERQRSEARPNVTVVCPDCHQLVDERRTSEDLEDFRRTGGRVGDGEAKPGSPGWHLCPKQAGAGVAQTQYDWRTYGR